MRACLRRRVHTSCRTEKHIQLRQPISSLHAAYRVCPRALSPVNPWLLGARGNGLCCIANWWSLVSCGDTDISHYSPSACVIWGWNPFVENCGKIRTEKGVLHQAEEWHVVPAPRMPAKHGFEIKHTHTHSTAAGGRKTLTCPPAKMTGDPEGLGR